MAENVTSPISTPGIGGMDIPASSYPTINPIPGKDINLERDPIVAESTKKNVVFETKQPKFNRTKLIQPKNLTKGDDGKTILIINEWQKYFESTNSFKTGGLYDSDKSKPSGFMPPEGFYQTDIISSETGFEQERGWINEPFQNYAFKGSNGNLKLYPDHEGSTINPYYYTNTADIDNNINNIYLEFKDEHIINKYAPQYAFTRGFSKDNDNKDRRLQNINFAEYETTVNNQDPIVFGYRLAIITETSPLFNGAIPDFLTKYSNMTELKTRLITYYQFFKSFFSLFEKELVNEDIRGGSRIGFNSNYDDLNKWYDKVINSQIYTRSVINDSEFTNSNKKNNFNKTPYYLKKITGLDKLIEKNGFDGKNNFTDYGTDIITLTLNEDTNLSTGSLIMLYKTLSWSKRSGKKMIPDNLLRFDIELTVSETRHYNRVMGNNIAADVPNKYTYILYECQFVFDKMSHGDSIDMSAIKVLEEGVDISFTYKYSTLKMTTYTPNVVKNDKDVPYLEYSEKYINNGKLNVYGDEKPIGATANNTIIKSNNTTNVNVERNISGKIGDFGEIYETSSKPLYNPLSKLPNEMDNADFDLNRVRNTVSATIIQPTITDKMKDEIRQLYLNTKLNKISNFNSVLEANDIKDNNQNVNSNVYSSSYNDVDIYNTNNFGQYRSLNKIDNIINVNNNEKILINSNTKRSIYAENVFLLPRIIPIIGLGFGSRNIRASAYVNLGVDNVYYDRFGISISGKFPIGKGGTLGGILSLTSNGLKGGFGLNL